METSGNRPQTVLVAVAMLIAVLSVVAPKLTGYDVTASAEQKLRVLAAWRKKLAAS